MGVLALAGALAATPAAAQQSAPGAIAVGPSAEESSPENPFDTDYLAIGAGAVLTPSYAGSDDYVVSPIPIVFASYGGITINPRAAGISVDFVPDPDEGIGLIAGVGGRLRADRATNIQDEVVESLGKLDWAVEVGPVVGFTVPKALNPYDRLSAQVAVGWDVAGAHSGMVVEPSVQYFTPLSRGIIASLSVSGEYLSGKTTDYYYRVTPAQSTTTGGVLPAFEPDGGGFSRVGTNLLLGFDLDGDFTNRGLALVGIAGYSRMLGDAKNSPFTSVRGSADQFLVGAGIGYVF